MLDTESRAGSDEVMMGYMYNQPLLSSSDEVGEKADTSGEGIHHSDKSPASSPGKSAFISLILHVRHTGWGPLSSTIVFNSQT